MGLSFVAPLAGRDEDDMVRYNTIEFSIHAPLVGRDTNKGANQNELHPIC